jgi:hypothetical protein
LVNQRQGEPWRECKPAFADGHNHVSGGAACALGKTWNETFNRLLDEFDVIQAVHEHCERWMNGELTDFEKKEMAAARVVPKIGGIVSKIKVSGQEGAL